MIYQKKDLNYLTFLLLSVVLCSFVIIFFVNYDSDIKKIDIGSVNVSYSIYSSSDMVSISNVDKIKKYKKYDAEKPEKIKSEYAYLKLHIINNEDFLKPLVITNKTKNYYSELLRAEGYDALPEFRYGDNVPLFETPFRSIKGGFPILLKPGADVVFYIEYSDPEGLVIDPQIMGYRDYIHSIVVERSLAGLISGILLFFVIGNIVPSILYKEYRNIFVIILAFEALFSFLKDSRILLILLSPWGYKAWLSSIPLTFKACALVVFFLTALRPYVTKRSFTFIIMVCITIMVLTIFSFFSESRFIFIALKIVILLLSVPIIYGFIKSIGEGVIDFLFTFISAIPWLLFELINNSFIFTHTGLTYTQSYALFLGKLSSLFFFILTFLYLNKRQYENAVDTAKAELKKSEEESHNIVSNVTELKGILINDLKYKLRQPVDSIISLVLILENAYKTPELLSITKVLAKEANGLKQEIEQGLLDYQSEVDNVVDSLNVNIEQLTSINTPWIDVSICIFDHNHVNSSHNALMLRSYGYKVSIIEEQYQILSAINDGKVDILIIDPSSTGERAFSLCSLIRSEYSLLDLPILMVTDYHRDFMMKKGFGAGVNDFLTKPFDFSEIVARIQSLIKLKNIAANNYDLAKSEKEKNTFLYFLTHNLNTPLTIMINRVNQLVQLDAPDVDKDLVEDLSASTLEMYDIVQNVLIAFRLSDGRQTVRFSELNLINIMNDLSKGLYKKAFEKQQHLYIDMPESVPMVYGDLSAVKGIIYNLVDNSLKFSPVGGKIYIKFIVGDNVVLEIIDNGPGIKEEEQALLFGRFQKLSTRPSAGESSTGLGLYVARELARLNGGDVLYESGHEGACFIFKLPLSDEALNG